MMKNFAYIILFFAAFGCKEKFNTNLPSPATGYLVVEGFISSGADPTSITLTRTVRLFDSAGIIHERNATVNVESENNGTFPLTESGNGVYTSPGSLNLNANEKYRVHIITKDNKEYVSDFESVQYTPPIDSISGQRENGGLRLYINTHDASNKTRYYKWNYEETWEIHSPFLSSLKYIVDPVSNLIVKVDYKDPYTHAPDTTVFKCWQSYTSNSTNIGSSEKLTTDVIYLPLLYIPPASEKLSVLYSVKLKQYALSHEAYLFYEKIKKNTENLGSVFDPQPSELQGNIHCISNPKEQVVGFVGISQEMNERIFIHNADVPGWSYHSSCDQKVIDNNEQSINNFGLGLIPTTPETVVGFSIEKFYATSLGCVDCTLRGTNIKPGFWP